MVKVVKIWQGFPIANHPDYIYIGRKCGVYPASIYGNPIHLEKSGDRQSVILKFIEYWYAPERKWLRKKALSEIRAHSTLCCWCHPLTCHGDIIAGYVNWKLSQTQMEFFL